MLNLRYIIGFFLKVWRETQRLLLVLWLCRISTVSALLALLLAFLPQMQDLYTEITYYKTPSWQDHINTLYYWFTFYALCFLWAFTVHYCARTILSFETWPLSRKDEAAYAYWIEAVPRFLGWVCIIAIFIGQINALQNLQIDNDHLTKTTSTNYAMPLFIVLMAIMALQTARRKLGKSAVMISALAIAYWLLTASGIYFKTGLSEQYQFQVMHNLALPVVTILWGVLFYYFVAERRPLLNWVARTFQKPHKFILHATRNMAHYFPVQIRPMHNAQTRANAPKFFPFQKRGLFQFEAPSENVRGLMIGLGCLTLIMLLWLAFAVSDPGTPPFGLERARLLPVLLGIWVPLLTTISFLSNQIRFPFLTLFIVLGLGMSWLVGDNHDVNIAAPLPPQQQALRPQKLALKSAIELWMEKHNCQTSPRTCPPPIIIAASGGASRSAFYVASVLGEFYDKPELFWPKNMPQNTRPKTTQDVTNQIFAISSVSGGSLGSAAYAALLRGHRANLFNGNPCDSQALRRDQLLFSVPENQEEKFNYLANWKNCLQAVTAGDFLSPAMVAYTFRDNLAFSSFIGLITGTDRAKALEQAWTRRAKKLTQRLHLNDPLLSYQPTKQHWMPLLLLNGTSVSTGKRLIATPLKVTYNRQDKIAFAPYAPEPPSQVKKEGQKNRPTAIFTDSLDLHHLLNFETLEPSGWRQNGQSQHRWPDISLAKAVSLSARFPLISPHGNLRALDGSIIDRVVDGGYFDNSGMLTALELAKAIQALSNNALKPLLVQISNHPVTLDTSPDSSQTQEKFRCPDQSFENRSPRPREKQILPELTAVASALLNARIARGSHAIARAFQEAGVNFVHFQVAAIQDEVGANKKLSMSWWLSKSVQNALNDQINWQRAQIPGQTRSIKQRLNPAFCAIQKFRKAQINHWKKVTEQTYHPQALDQ